MEVFFGSLVILSAVLLASGEVKWTQNERGEWEYDESDPELLKAAERLGLLSSALQDVGDHERIAEWLAKVRTSGADAYVDELGPLLYDAVAITMMASYNAQRLFGLGTESDSYVLLKENFREKLLALGFRAPKYHLRYVAKSSDADDIDRNVDEFAALFRAHITKLLTRVDAQDVTDIEGHLMADIVQFRQWMETRWTRISTKESQRLVPENQKVPSAEEAHVHESL
ncbi:hypothetical protein AAVH_23736 [Aphelenchoides avenae]|nr:hypothetical protein AAVH_41723 [Aphelenchus avenae]KAH7708993.1 hypothetical protein AAVH_23736 [Aphelenchus avenae]